MIESNLDSDVWFFQFIDHDNLSALEFEDMIICNENINNLSDYEINNSLIGKSKNELIEKMINHLQGLKDD